MEYLSEIATGLKFISVGSSRTTFYHDGRAYQSSVIGDLLTVIFALAFITYAAVTFNSIINTEHDNLDSNARDLAAYTFKGSQLTDQRAPCVFCEVFTVGDFLKFID